MTATARRFAPPAGGPGLPSPFPTHLSRPWPVWSSTSRTSALGLEHFDEAQQEYLFRDASRLSDPDEQARRRAEITQQFSLWPPDGPGGVHCHGECRLGQGSGAVSIDDFEEEEDVSSGVEFAPQVDEAELLTAFWDVARRYDQIVTFKRTRLRRSLSLPPFRAAQCSDFAQGLARVPIPDRTALRPRRAVHLYNVSGRDGAARSSIRILLQDFRDSLAQGAG